MFSDKQDLTKGYPQRETPPKRPKINVVIESRGKSLGGGTIRLWTLYASLRHT